MSLRPHATTWNAPSAPTAGVLPSRLLLLYLTESERTSSGLRLSAYSAERNSSSFCPFFLSSLFFSIIFSSLPFIDSIRFTVFYLLVTVHSIEAVAYKGQAFRGRSLQEEDSAFPESSYV